MSPPELAHAALHDGKPAATFGAPAGARAWTAPEPLRW
jgi:hypothetical protein